MDVTQIANSWDAKTKEKVFKGLCYSLAGGVAFFLIIIFLGVDTAKALIASAAGVATPALINAFNEWKKGVLEEGQM